jgi:hypothetical protein
MPRLRIRESLSPVLRLFCFLVPYYILGQPYVTLPFTSIQCRDKDFLQLYPPVSCTCSWHGYRFIFIYVRNYIANLTRVYNIQNYWVSGLRPASRILNRRKHNVSETGFVSALRWGEGGTQLVLLLLLFSIRFYTWGLGTFCGKNCHPQLYLSSTLCMLHNFYCVLSSYLTSTQPDVRCLYSCCYMTWDVSCGGVIEYLKRSPARRKRRRKWNPVPGATLFLGDINTGSAPPGKGVLRSGRIKYGL